MGQKRLSEIWRWLMHFCRCQRAGSRSMIGHDNFPNKKSPAPCRIFFEAAANRRGRNQLT
jgi:hypothetical protein